MAELAGAADGAPVDAAVEHHPEADASSEADDEEVVDVSAMTEPSFVCDECVDVVVDDDGEAGSMSKVFGEVGVAPIEVGGVADDAGVTVDYSGEADSDAVYGLSVGLFDEPFGEPCNGCDDVIFGSVGQFRAVAGFDVGVEVDKDPHCSCFGELDADDVASGGVERNQDGLASAG